MHAVNSHFFHCIVFLKLHFCALFSPVFDLAGFWCYDNHWVCLCVSPSALILFYVKFIYRVQLQNSK
ncbi:hypothetical protein FKM82_008409 [Ascaphus truei]